MTFDSVDLGLWLQPKFIFCTCLIFSLGASAENLQCPPLDNLGQRRIDSQAQQILEQCVKEEPITKSLYYDQKTRQYSASRSLLHRKIIDKIIKTNSCVSVKKPVVIFTAGLPGGGKTTFIKKRLKNFNNYVIIDADLIRKKLLEDKGWNAFNTQTEVNEVIANALERIGKPCKFNLIYDSSLSSPDRYIRLTKHLKAIGYKVYIIYAKVPIGVVKDRILKRYQRNGRYVSSNFIQYVNEHLEASFAKVKKEVDGYIIFNGVDGSIIEIKGNLRDFHLK